MLNKLIQRRDEVRDSQFSWPDYLRLWEQFGFNGVQYVVPSGNVSQLTALQGARNPIVAACIYVRLLVFSEVRFAFQRWSAGRPGELYGTPELRILERPWVNASTGDLLARMEVDASLYGNSYWVRRDNELIRLDPNHVVIATGDVLDMASGRPFGRRLLGYSYVDDRNNENAFFTPDEVCHYKPLPDPMHQYRGLSWLASIMPDVTADQELTVYKHAFLRNSATPQLVVKFEPGVSREAFDKFREQMNTQHRGAAQGFKTLFLGSGADVKTVGANFEQLAFKAVQGAGETRIAAAAGVPASILGISEGLAGSALNSGNYTAARRRFADGTIRPLWRAASASLQNIVLPPDGGSRLWYDERDVSFLQEDVLDAANIKQRDANTMRTLIDGGFDPQTVVDAVTTGDMTRLVHTGQLSVQLQKPGA
jgi:phage portal protein BeeE